MRAKIPACSSVTCSTCLCADARGPSASSVTGPADGGATFGEIADRAARVAAVLGRRGLQQGDRLAVQLPNRLEFIDLVLACVQSGVVLVPINVLYREREIAHIVGDAEPKLIVTTDAQRALFPPGSPVADVDELMREADGATGGVARPAIDGDAPAAIVYTRAPPAAPRARC